MERKCHLSWIMHHVREAILEKTMAAILGMAAVGALRVCVGLVLHLPLMRTMSQTLHVCKHGLRLVVLGGRCSIPCMECMGVVPGFHEEPVVLSGSPPLPKGPRFRLGTCTGT